MPRYGCRTDSRGSICSRRCSRPSRDPLVAGPVCDPRRASTLESYPWPTPSSPSPGYEPYPYPYPYPYVASYAYAYAYAYAYPYP